MPQRRNSSLSMFAKKIDGLQDALQGFRHLEALALLFHAIAEDDGQKLFGEARAELNEKYPKNLEWEGEIDRLAGLLSDAAQGDKPFVEDDVNLLLLTSALARHIGENFLAIPNPEVCVQGRQYHLLPLPSSRLIEDWTSPRRWFHPLWFVPEPFQGKEIKVSATSWAEGNNPVCALVEFDDKVSLDLETEGDTFTVRGLADENKRWNSIETALNTASKADAQILVLPELCITRTLLGRLSDWLNTEEHPFRLVAAGSYHHRDNDSDKLARNRMMVLNHCGGQLFLHDKLYEFDRPLRERLSPGNTLHLMRTPIGLLSFAICKDFGHVDGMDWKALPLDGLCIASMGDDKTVSAHRAAARNMKLAGTRVLLANITKESNGTHPGFFSQHNGDPQANTGNVTIRHWNEPENQESPKRPRPKLKIVK